MRKAGLRSSKKGNGNTARHRKGLQFRVYDDLAAWEHHHGGGGGSVVEKEKKDIIINVVLA